MGLRIIKKVDPKKGDKMPDKRKSKQAVVTILGIQNAAYNDNGIPFIKDYTHQANYYFENDSKHATNYYNTLELLIKNYEKTYEIVPIYTSDAKVFNQDVLRNYKECKCNFDDTLGLIEDEKDYNAIFSLIDNLINMHDRVIVDLTHGFRHLPILMIIDLVIQNFQKTDKIEKILFAKEIVKHTPIEKGEYEIIDLKEYLDIANISFILTNFASNFTVASHIQSHKYQSLIDKLNNFSNDIMALSLNNLFKKSSKELVRELGNIDDIAIKKQAYNLAREIETITSYRDQKRYKTYHDLAKVLFEKDYMLLSLSLLFESIRLYIKSSIKEEHKELVEDVEKKLNNNLYKICDFFKNLKWKNFSKYKKDNKAIKISECNYTKLKKSFPKHIETLYDDVDKLRNNLAHANSDNRSYKDIRNDIEKLFKGYEEKCFK